MLSLAVFLWVAPVFADPGFDAALDSIEVRAVDASREYTIPEFDHHGAFIRGPDSMQAVALTFDDGPDLDTPEILAVLARHHAKATFFMIGEQVLKHPEYARQVLAAGHEIGNHTFSHRNFCGPEMKREKDPRKVIRDEVANAAAAIHDATGFQPTLVRIPYACRSALIENTVEQMGFTVVRWSVDGEDWARPGAAKLTRYYLEHAEPGAVMLFHDGGGNGSRGQTVRAVDAILTGLEKRGLRNVTVSEMLDYARSDTSSTAR